MCDSSLLFVFKNIFRTKTETIRMKLINDWTGPGASKKEVLIMADATKMTQRDYFNEIIALAKANERDDLVEFAEGRIAILDKKKNSSKMTKTQEENIAIKAILAEVVGTFAEGATVSEILKSDDRLADFSNQKVSALLRQLVDEGKVVKTTDKKKSIFSIAEVVAE